LSGVPRLTASSDRQHLVSAVGTAPNTDMK
jgi:hypothetical protein